MIKNKDSMRKADQVAAHLQSKTLTRHIGPIYDEVERCLSIWIREETKQSSPLSFSAISRKALNMFENLQEGGWKVREGTHFTASKGWFARFKNQTGLHNLIIIIIISGEAASADNKAGAPFPSILKN